MTVQSSGTVMRDGLEGEKLRTKTCPQCGQELFEDMNVCYGCLYDFTREPSMEGMGLPAPLLEEEESDESDVTLSLAALRMVEGGAARHQHISSCGCEFGLFIQTGDVDLTVPLGEEGIMIGRLPTNDIVLHSRAISRHHVLITPKDGGAHVENQGATNPALLKGREVTDAGKMFLGDTLNVCGTLLTLVELGGEEPAKVS